MRWLRTAKMDLLCVIRFKNVCNGMKMDAIYEMILWIYCTISVCDWANKHKTAKKYTKKKIITDFHCFIHSTTQNTLLFGQLLIWFTMHSNEISIILQKLLLSKMKKKFPSSEWCKFIHRIEIVLAKLFLCVVVFLAGARQSDHIQHSKSVAMHTLFQMMLSFER